MSVVKKSVQKKLHFIKAKIKVADLFNHTALITKTNQPNK